MLFWCCCNCIKIRVWFSTKKKCKDLGAHVRGVCAYGHAEILNIGGRPTDSGLVTKTCRIHNALNCLIGTRIWISVIRFSFGYSDEKEKIKKKINKFKRITGNVHKLFKKKKKKEAFYAGKTLYSGRSLNWEMRIFIKKKKKILKKFHYARKF